jgi:hypothetical protein
MNGLILMLSLMGVVYFTTRWALDDDRKGKRRRRKD